VDEQVKMEGIWLAECSRRYRNDIEYLPELDCFIAQNSNIPVAIYNSMVLQHWTLADKVSISPTFLEQLLRQNPFAKKLQTQISST
jgi:hypothetical protein